MWFGDIFSIIFPIMFILIVGVIIISIFKGIKEWSYNNKQPIIPVDAIVVAKRGHTTHHHNNNTHTSSSSTTYYITFEFSNREMIELRVPSAKYGLIAEGDNGILYFQGSRFISFERNIV